MLLIKDTLKNTQKDNSGLRAQSQDGGVCISSQLGHLLGAGGGPQTPKGMRGIPT